MPMDMDLGKRAEKHRSERPFQHSKKETYHDQNKTPKVKRDERTSEEMLSMTLVKEPNGEMPHDEFKAPRCCI